MRQLDRDGVALCYEEAGEEEEYAELAARRIGAAVRGEVLREIEEARPGV